MSSLQFVHICPRRRSEHDWVKSKVVKVYENGFIYIPNDTDRTVKIPKHDHFADMRVCYPIYVNKIYDLLTNDEFHLIPYTTEDVPTGDSFLTEINPYHQLFPEWRTKCTELCSEFSEIITPRPGKYNGYYGRIDNSINFSVQPPPTVRAHHPKYSHDIMKILAAKMDKLEQWAFSGIPRNWVLYPSS